MQLNLIKLPAMIFSKKLKSIALIQLIEKDLDRLEKLEGGAVKKISLKKDFLYQSYIIHLTASWQEFNKELVEYAFSALQKNSDSNVMNDIAKRRVNDLLKKFNTPSTSNVNSLYKDAFGIVNVSSCWCFDGVDNQTAIDTLNNVLKIRHQIAHKGFSEEELNYEINFENMEIIYDIACATQIHVLSFLNIK